MLLNSYYFEKVFEFNQKEIEKQSKDWWKKDKTKREPALKNSNYKKAENECKSFCCNCC